MSELKPKGSRIMFDGEERELLFTLSAVEQLQEETDLPLDALMQQFLQEDTERMLLVILRILLNDEAERKKYFENKELPRYEEKEMGWLVTTSNVVEYITAILEAYGISMPKAEEDATPNRNSGNTKK